MAKEKDEKVKTPQEVQAMKAKIAEENLKKKKK